MDYDPKDLQSVLLYMRRKCGVGVFEESRRMVSMLLDLSPGLKRDGNVLRQMSEAGLLRELHAAVDTGGKHDRQRVVMKSRSYLMDYLQLPDGRANFYMTALQVAYGLAVDMPSQPVTPSEPPPPKPQSKSAQPAPPKPIGTGHTGDCTWTLESSGVLTISGHGKMGNYSYINQSPWHERSDIYSVIIQDGVMQIGDYAFLDCKSLKSVDISASVMQIGSHAFCNCESLTSVNIPNGVTQIGDSAFRFCRSLSSVHILDSVTKISGWAFKDCKSLKSVSVPGGAEIDARAFESITHIELKPMPKSQPTPPKRTGTIMDSGRTGNCTWTLYRGVLTISGHGKMENYSVENKSPWTWRSDIYSVIIQGGVTQIGDDAFSLCQNLTSVNIPASVTQIGKCAFYACTNLKSVNIPASVTQIGECAFDGCESLTSVNIPASVAQIGRHAFLGCTRLTSVSVPRKAEIEKYAFDPNTHVLRR